MTAKKLLPFIIVLAVLGGLVMLRKGQEYTPTLVEQAGLESLTPADLDAKDIVKVELYAASKPDEKVVLERADDAWQIASQFNAPADEETIKTYLDKLVKLRGELREEVSDEAQLAAYDLKTDDSFHVCAYEKADGEPVLNILVGKSPKYNSVFLRKDGDMRVFEEAFNPRSEAGVYGEDIGTAPTASKWLNKDIVTLDKEKFTKVAVDMPDKKLVFEKKAVEKPKPEGEGEGEGEMPPTPAEFKWELTEGGPGGVYKETAFNNLLLKASSIKASDVVDPAKLADWGLEKPEFRCVISTQEGKDVVLEGGRPDLASDGYLRVASSGKDTVYKVSQYDFGQLFPKGKDLFTLMKPAMTQDSISRVVIEQPSGQVVLAKEGENWTVRKPQTDLEVQTSAITTLASTLATWQPEDYADAGTATGDFDRSITVTADGMPVRIQLAGPSKSVDGFYAKIGGGGQILVMRAGDEATLFLEPREVYSMKLINLPESDINDVELRQGDLAVTLARKGDGWTKGVGGVGATDTITFADADTETCGDLTYALTELEAKDFKAGSPADVTPDAAIEVHGGGKNLNLTVGPEEGGLRTVAIEGADTLFEVEKSEIDPVLEALPKLTQMEEAAPADGAAAEPSEAAAEDPAAAAEEMPVAAPAEEETPALIAAPPAAPAGDAAKDTPASVIVAPEN